MIDVLPNKSVTLDIPGAAPYCNPARPGPPRPTTIVRHKLYTFRSLLSNTWRQGGMMVAGDVAHVMPPFMGQGQGLCAGLRGDWNLAWKLSLVLDGKADDRLLDSYQAKRRPHVSDVIDVSMFLGKIICISDPAQAAERDAAADLVPLPERWVAAARR